MTTEEKIKNILNTNELCEVLPIWRPESHNKDYYFVSYAHADYKAVYKDIFAFQSKGINIWYDAGMRATVSWKEIAKIFIHKYECKGVIFYISESSIMSAAIHEEMEYVRKCGKDFIVINLPILKELFFEDKSWYGRMDYSALKLLNILSHNNVEEITNDKYAFVKRVLHDDVRYVRYDASVENKISELKSLMRTPLLELEHETSGKYTVKGINDIDIIQMYENDFVFKDDQKKTEYFVSAIQNCAFANCRYLSTVELPQSIRWIDEFAFYGCNSLKEINLDNVNFIGNHAFDGCSSLKRVNIQNVVEVIQSGVFSDCTNLESVCIGNNVLEIWDFAFSNCKKLKDLKIGLDVEIISEYAFNNCESLVKVLLPPGLKEIEANAFSRCYRLMRIVIPNKVKTLGDAVFYDCRNLKKVVLESNLKSIGDSAFEGCKALSVIEFKGTIQSWSKIKKGVAWDLDTGEYIIHCSDGEIKK